MKRTIFSLLLSLAPVVSAQPAAPAPSDDHQLVLQLLARVQQLEAEVQSLRAASPAGAAPVLAATPQPAAAPPSPAGPTPGPTTGQTVAQAPTLPPDTMGGMMHSPDLPGLQIRGFSDIQFRDDQVPGDHSTFALGELNLFITSKISERFNVLTELVVEADTDNEMGVDLERLLFQYSANDYFNLSVGRYHTAIGYYNTAYHHSTWLQTTFDRPFLFAFEDQGGILPIHNVGLSATGRIPSGSLGLHYVAEIGNGRASRTPLDEPVQNVQDENNRKAFNLAVYAKPDSLRGLQTGASFYRDVLTPDGQPRIGQDIFSGHAIYEGSRFEFMNEAVVLRHALDGGKIYHIPAFYSQISERFGRLRPYFRYEYMNVPRNEPMFGDVGLRHGPVAGARWDFSEFAAYKLEYFRLLERDVPGANGIRTQVSFTF